MPGRRRCPVIGATVPGLLACRGRDRPARHPRAVPRPRPRPWAPGASRSAPSRPRGHRGAGLGDAVITVTAATGHRRRARAGARRLARGAHRALERRGRWVARRRHARSRRVLRRRGAGRRGRARRGGAPRRGRGRRRVLRRAPAGPPRHPARAMGFCLFNNVAVTAAALAERGRAGADRRLRRPPRQRHPGRVLARRAGRVRLAAPVPALPRHRRACARWARARGGARPSTCRCPRERPATPSWPRSTRWWPRSPRPSTPTWLLLSAGFDAHRADPITDLGLSAGDYADLTAAAARAGPARAGGGVPRGRLRPRGAGAPRRRPASAAARRVSGSCPRPPTAVARAGRVAAAA